MLNTYQTAHVEAFLTDVRTVVDLEGREPGQDALHRYYRDPVQLNLYGDEIRPNRLALWKLLRQLAVKQRLRFRGEPEEGVFKVELLPYGPTVTLTRAPYDPG